MSNSLRLRKLTLNDFRCFRREELDLSGDVTLIYARNGAGKTAVFDAIELALLGEVGRFQAESAAGLEVFANFYGAGGFGVSLEIESNGKRAEEIKIRWDSEKGLELATLGRWTRHRDLVYEFLVNKDALRPPRREVRLAAELFRASVLLSQQSMRRFVEGDPETRSRVISQLAGTAFQSRCMDKAREVEREAGRRLTDVRNGLLALKTQVAERQAALTAFTESAEKLRSLVSGAVGHGQLKEALEHARISREFLDEAIALAPDHLVETVDSRIEASRLEVEDELRKARRAQGALKRFGELREQLATQEKSAAEHQTESDEQMEAIEAATETVVRLESEFTLATEAVGQAQKALENVREANALREQRAALEEVVKEAKSRVEPILKRVEGLVTELDQLEKRHGELLEENTRETERASTAELALQRLVASLEGWKQLAKLSEERERRAKEKAKTEKELAESEAVTASLTRRSEEARQAEAALQREYGVERGNSERWESLASQLAEFAHDRDCPLCGLKYETHDLLKKAIDTRLKAIPAALRSLSARLEAGTKARERLEVELAALDEKLKPARAAITSAQSEIRRLDDARQELEAQGFHKLDPDSVEAEVAEKRTELRQALEATKALESKIAKLTAQRGALGEQREKEAERVTRLQAEIRDTESQREAIDSSLKELLGDRPGNDATAPTEEESKKPVEEAKRVHRRAEKALSKQRAALKQLETQHERASEKGRKMQNRIADIRTQLAEHDDIFETAGFKAVPEPGDLEKAVARLEDRRTGLERARNPILARVRDLKLEATDSTETLLQKELAESEAEYAAFDARASILTTAMNRAAQWATRLEEEIGNVVADRVRRHRGPIWRLFSGMIPDAYRFDGLDIEEIDGGVNLGIRFRDVAASALEPRIYLSQAQANVLALAVYFSFAMAQRWSHLGTLLLDDPVQHLDDLDAVAFIDTVRACVSQPSQPRQVVISTCDHDLYMLLLRKLGLLEYEGLRVTGVTLRDRGPEGPKVCYDFGGPTERTLFAAAG